MCPFCNAKGSTNGEFCTTCGRILPIKTPRMLKKEAQMEEMYRKLNMQYIGVGIMKL